MKDETMNRIREVVCVTLLLEDVTLQEDLFEAGYLDSLAIVTLMVSLESEFGITLPVETVDLDQFRSVDSIYRLISPLQSISA